MTRTVAELTQQVARVTGTAFWQTVARAGISDLHAFDPEPFEGDLDKCR